VTSELNHPYPLTAAHIAQFREQGFIKLKNVFSAELLRDYGAEITRLTLALNTQTLPLEQRSTYDRAFLQVMNLWEHSARVREFVLGQRLGKLATDLLEVDGVRLYHDQALYKEPGGGITPAHADQYYWPFASDRSITAWIPLQAVPADMGPLAFFARSQSVALGRELPISDDSERAINAAMRSEGFIEVNEPFDLGEVSFHLGWTFHRAGANTSTQARSVMTIIYMDDAMRLNAPSNANQVADWQQWCPGAAIGAVIATPKNLPVYSRSPRPASMIAERIQ
jgi:ectoine hydroxylase-related dioxygenase (phytanoyl-CoA dioxygenase family)